MPVPTSADYIRIAGTTAVTTIAITMIAIIIAEIRCLFFEFIINLHKI